jgi:hypothetical protein
MKAKQQAQQIFNAHYIELLLSDSDYSNEVLISVMAQKAAMVTVNYIIENCNSAFWQNVKTEIQKL